MDLPALTGRGRTGLRREFVACYREEFAFVWRALLRLGVARSECDDAAQDVFVTAYRRWATLRDAARRRAWLFGIVRRIAWRQRRTVERRERRLDAVAHAPVTAIDLEDHLACREAWTALASFLEGLDEEKRAVFVLGELEALGRRELGDALGINPNTAYSRLQAARRSFLDHFAAYDDDRVARLLAHATFASEAPPAASARTWARILVVLAAPSTLASASGWAAVAFAVATAGAVAATTRASEPPMHDASMTPPLEPPVSPEPRASSPSAAPVIAVSTPDPNTASHVIAAARKRVRAPSPSVEPATIDEEVALLVAARAALVRGALSETQQHLDDHRRKYGTSTTLAHPRAQIERDLATASIGARRSGDSIRVEDHP